MVNLNSLLRQKDIDFSMEKLKTDLYCFLHTELFLKLANDEYIDVISLDDHESRGYMNPHDEYIELVVSIAKREITTCSNWPDFWHC